MSKLADDIARLLDLQIEVLGMIGVCSDDGLRAKLGDLLAEITIQLKLAISDLRRSG